MKQADVNPARVAARKAGRAAAAELIGLLDPPVGHGADYAEALVEELRSRLPRRRNHVPTEPAPPPFAAVRNVRIPFGKYVGKRLDEAPLEYLDWLLRSQEGFHHALRAYLNHEAVERERG